MKGMFFMQNEPAEILEMIPEKVERMRKEIGRKVYGQERLANLLLAGILARGHCLLTGVPGLAKTMLISTLAETAELDFKRIQFTPDMMPGDVTGNEILEIDKLSGERMFKFMPGPVFAQLLLADEINRTTPKTQAALLEAMQERSVTAAGKTHPLPEPFFVLATQNPIEQEGTYPLPEAQLDRFMFGLTVDYPSLDDEVRIIRETTSGIPAPLEKVVTAAELVRMQEAIRWIPVPESVALRIAKIVRATRPSAENRLASQYFRWGAGPRAGQFLALAGKVFAAFDGRSAVSDEDVLAALEPVLLHRLVLNYRAESENAALPDLLKELLKSVK